MQIYAVPPKVSFIHPADLIAPVQILSPHGPQIFNQTTPPFPMNTSFMTPAQRLYASSGNMSVGPTISSHNIASLSTAPELPNCHASPLQNISMLPTPPSSTSPSRNEIRSFVNKLPPSRLAGRDDGLYSSAVNVPQNLGTNPTYLAMTSNSWNSSHSENERLQPHRMFTSPSPVPNVHTSHTTHGRHHAYSVGSVSQNISSVNSTISVPRPTPHLITKAKPPELAGNQSNLLVNSSGASGSSNNQLSRINLDLTSPPSSSLLFSQVPANQILSPVSPPLSGSSSVSGSISPVSALQISPVTHSASTNARHQHDPTKLITMLRMAFSQGGTRISESDLQAVAYAQPDANYQSVIIALKRLQSQVKLHGTGVQHQQLLANYQALIIQVENLCALTQSQLPQGLQQGAMDVLKQQQATLAQQQLLLQQQAQQEAQLKVQMLQQQQEAATAALQAQQKQQQELIAQQQALLQQQEQANQQLQTALQQQAASNTTQIHQSMLEAQHQQGQSNTQSVTSTIVSHFADALIANCLGQSNQTEPTPSSDTGSSLLGTITQGLVNTAVGNNQDSTSGISNLLGGITQSWLDSSGGVDPSSLVAGLDFSSFGDNS